MTAIPRTFKITVTVLMVVLVAVAVVGAVARGNPLAGAVLGTLFLTTYVAGAVYASNAHSARASQRVGWHHRSTLLWILSLTALWIGLLVVSDKAMWLAFPLVLLQVGILGPSWGALTAFLTIAATVVVSLARLGPGESPAGAVLGPLLGGAIAFIFMWGIITVIKESTARKLALERLQKTQAQLEKAEEDRVVIRERQRLAGEIHDTVSQGLSATAMLLRAAQATSDPAQMRSLLDQALGAAEDNLADARRITMALAPRELSGVRLPEALRDLCESASWGDLDVTFLTCSDQINLSLAQEAALLRIAQSALSNIVEHADASAASLTLTCDSAGDITLEIADNGKGFAKPTLAAEGRGAGLRIMAARMKDVGGTVTVVPSSNGTKVTATLPVGTELLESERRS